VFSVLMLLVGQQAVVCKKAHFNTLIVKGATG